MTRAEANKDPEKLAKVALTRYVNMALGKHKPRFPNKPVHCIDKNMTFLSVRLAAKEFGVSHQAIWNAVTGKQHSCAACLWRYATEEEVAELLAKQGIKGDSK